MTRGRGATALPAILAAFACYAIAFIYRTSFVVGGVRYFALFDDAMISMRYAKNLAAGYGLVYNPGGPRVEGFTNPLWTLCMAALHLLPVSAPKISLLIQLTGAVCLAATVILVWRLVVRFTEGSTICAAAAAVWTAFYLPLDNWTLQGFEVGPLALIITLAVSRAIDAVSDDRFDLTVYALFGAASLIRLDALVPAIAASACLAAVDAPRRNRHLKWGFGALAALTLAQTGARLLYFGYPFPNTYYLKMTGYPAAMRIARGVLVMAAFVWRFNVLLFAAAFFAIVAPARPGAPRARAGLWIAGPPIAAVLVYSVYVGGDAWEWWGGANRYVSPVMPLFFALLGTAAADAGVRLSGAPPAGARGAAVVSLVTALVLVNVNYLRRPTSLAEFALINPPFTVPETAQYVKTASELSRVIDDSATIGVIQAGTLPYFTGHDVIDMLGKNDARIAHEPMHVPKTAGLQRVKDFFPGHMKWDFPYAIGELKPDVVVELGRFPEEALPQIRGAYQLWRSGDTTFYLRSGSPHVRWTIAAADGTLSDP